MEKSDHELISNLVPENLQLKKLYNEHVKLEKEVLRFDRLANYSPSMALRLKEVKKKKLLGVEAMMRILEAHRKSVAG